MTCRCSIHCAFRWAEFPRPSLFTEKTFTGASTTGKTLSQTSSEWVDRVTKASGKNPGSLMGISLKGNLAVEAGNQRRRAGK